MLGAGLIARFNGTAMKAGQDRVIMQHVEERDAVRLLPGQDRLHPFE
jgi:hypothetical protein